jgi:hypothetical protein
MGHHLVRRNRLRYMSNRHHNQKDSIAGIFALIPRTTILREKLSRRLAENRTSPCSAGLGGGSRNDEAQGVGISLFWYYGVRLMCDYPLRP